MNMSDIKNFKQFNENLNMYEKPIDAEIKIIGGFDELKKKTKYGYVTVIIGGNQFHLTPEDVNLRLKYRELIKRGYKREDLDEILELQKNYTEREARDSNID